MYFLYFGVQSFGFGFRVDTLSLNPPYMTRFPESKIYLGCQGYWGYDLIVALLKSLYC